MTLSRLPWLLLVFHMAACESNSFEASRDDLPEPARSEGICPHVRAMLRLDTRASRVIAHMELKNMTTSPFRLFNVNDLETQRLYEVYRGGEEVQYRGKMFSGGGVPLEERVELEPGDSISFETDLTKPYGIRDEPAHPPYFVRYMKLHSPCDGNWLYIHSNVAGFGKRPTR